MFTSVILLKASTEQIPTYKQYKYLRHDPTETEMAQATVNKEMDIKKLSEVASVTVTQQGDVKFMVIPKEEVLLETEVVFTRRNWISFVTVGRPKILQAIHDKKDVKFLCHGLKIRVFYFFYISKTLEMIRISFMASLLNAVL